MQAEPEDADRLSERGWEQARGLGERLHGEGIEAILASPFGRAQETAQAIGEVLGLGSTPTTTCTRCASPTPTAPRRRTTRARATSPGCRPTRPSTPSPAPSPSRASSRASRTSRSAWRQRVESERILCVSHWGFLHFFLGAAIFREDFSPAHLPALYRISHINTGITLFEKRRDYLIEGVRFDGWALQTWNDKAHL